MSLVVMGLASPEDSEPRNPGSIAYRVLRMGHVAVVVVPGLPRRPRPTSQPPGMPHQEPGLEFDDATLRRHRDGVGPIGDV